MHYIPFEQITEKLYHDLVARGYKDFVLQKFEWPSVTFGKGFLLSAYESLELAKENAIELDITEGKSLHKK